MRVSRSTAAIIRAAPTRPITDRVSLSNMNDAAAVSMGWVHWSMETVRELKCFMAMFCIR